MRDLTRFYRHIAAFSGCFEVVKPHFYVFVCLFVVMFSHEKPQARKSDAKK